MSAKTQTQFAEALLDAGRPVPAGVVSHTSRSPARRYGVYRNNVVAGLVEALRARFPVVEEIVGEEFFRAMARVFVIEEPPSSQLLMQFGDELPRFLERFEPAAELPYLPDVARLEAARTRAFHAADAQPIDAARLSALDLGAIGASRLVLHPSLQVIRSHHPIVTIWAMNSGELALAPIENWDGEDALVARPAQTVIVRKIPPGGAAFIEALQGGTLEDAASIAAQASRNFDLATNLAELIGTGLIIDIA